MEEFCQWTSRIHARKGDLCSADIWTNSDAIFHSPVGVRSRCTRFTSEFATLPTSFAQKGVQEVSFKTAFDPDFLQKVKFLRDLGLLRANRSPSAAQNFAKSSCLTK